MKTLLLLALSLLQSPVTIKTTATLAPTWEDVRAEWYRPGDCEYGEDGGMGCKRMILMFGGMRVVMARNGEETALPASVGTIVAAQHPEASAGRLIYFPKFCKPLPNDLRGRYVCGAPKGDRIRWVPVKVVENQ